MIGTLVARKALAGAFDALNRHDLGMFMSARREIPEGNTAIASA